jgi:hypothetical protein
MSQPMRTEVSNPPEYARTQGRMGRSVARLVMVDRTKWPRTSYFDALHRTGQGVRARANQLFKMEIAGGDSSRRFAAVFGQSATGVASYSEKLIGPAMEDRL